MEERDSDIDGSEQVFGFAGSQGARCLKKQIRAKM